MNSLQNTEEEETVIKKINYSLQFYLRIFQNLAQHRNKLYDIEHELKYHYHPCKGAIESN